MSVTARYLASKDTMASAAVNNCGKNDISVRHLAWVVLGSIELVMERVRYRSLVLCDLVFCGVVISCYWCGVGEGF